MQICLKPSDGQEKLIYSSRKPISDCLGPGVGVGRLTRKKHEELFADECPVFFDCGIGYTPNGYLCQNASNCTFKSRTFSFTQNMPQST